MRMLTRGFFHSGLVVAVTALAAMWVIYSTRSDPYLGLGAITPRR